MTLHPRSLAAFLRDLYTSARSITRGVVSTPVADGSLPAAASHCSPAWGAAATP